MTDTIILSNTRGFQKDKDHINSFVGTHKPIVFLVVEHFQSTTNHLKLDGYVLAAYYCRSARERGGVAIFVRVDVDFAPRKDLDVFNVKKEFEVRSIEIPSRNVVVTVVYRPPSGSLKRFHVNLENLLQKYKQRPQQKHVMGGDFNIDNMESNTTEGILARHKFNFTYTWQTHELGRCLDNFVVDFVPSTTRVMREKLSDHQCLKFILPRTPNVVPNNFKSILEELNSKRHDEAKTHPFFPMTLNNMLPPSSNNVVKENSILLSSRGSPDPPFWLRKPAPFARDPQRVTCSSLNHNLVPFPHGIPEQDSVNTKYSSDPVLVNRQMTNGFPRPTLDRVTHPTTSSNMFQQNPTLNTASCLQRLGSNQVDEKFLNKVLNEVKDSVMESLSKKLEESNHLVQQLHNKVYYLEAKIDKLESQILEKTLVSSCNKLTTTSADSDDSEDL